ADFDKKVQRALTLRAKNGAVGPKGATGPQGPAGKNGQVGAGLPGADGHDGANGVDGLSAFVIWQQTHPGQTEDQFLAALQGAPGQDGTNGTNGIDGKDGVQSVTELAVDDSPCKYGGWVITFSTGDTAQVCNGQPGKDGKDGA